jgi:hypothetical protein
MLLPPLNRLSVSSFKGQESWISALLYPLNQLFQSLTSGLQNGITFKDNIACIVKTLNFNNNVNAFPIKFQNTLSTAPMGVWVINIQDVSNSPKALTNPVCVTSWQFVPNTRTVNINAVSGLISGQQYNLTVVVI